MSDLLFQALRLIVLAVFGAVGQPLAMSVKSHLDPKTTDIFEGETDWQSRLQIQIPLLFLP